MTGLRFGAAFALAGLMLLAAAGARSQTALPPLNMVPSAPEELGRVPNHFFWLRDGLQAVQDPVDGQLVFISDAGQVVGRAALPREFRIEEIVPEFDEVRLVDVAGRRQVMVARTLDPAAVTSFAASAVKANGQPRRLRLVRTSSQRLLYLDESRSGARELDIRAIGGGILAQAYEVGSKSTGNRYIVSEEIVSSKPLQVRVFVQRFDRSGSVTGVAFLSLDEMDVVPRDFVSVTDTGMLRVLVPTATGVKITEIGFSPPPGKRSGGALRDNDLKGLGTTERDIPVDTNVAKVHGLRGFQSEPGGPRFRIGIPTPPISRKHVLANARAYLTVNWVMTRENYAKPGIENLCQPSAAKFWLRPLHFTPGTIGKTIGPMPYRWGGDDTPGSFRLRMDWGALAGDICTCRDPALDYCLTLDSAGVDCSGFVSRAWGIEKRGTAGLLDVASELSSMTEMRPGDAFNRPGRHVRLFVQGEPGSQLAYTVLESTTRIDCEGVCERTYRPSELNGYRIIRYRGIIN
jgi:hypothetical protein